MDGSCAKYEDAWSAKFQLPSFFSISSYGLEEHFNYCTSKAFYLKIFLLNQKDYRGIANGKKLINQCYISSRNLPFYGANASLETGLKMLVPLWLPCTLTTLSTVLCCNRVTITICSNLYCGHEVKFLPQSCLFM